MDAIAIRDVLLERQAHPGNVIRSFARGGDQPWRKIRISGSSGKAAEVPPRVAAAQTRGIGVEAQKQPPNLAALFELEHETLPDPQGDGSADRAGSRARETWPLLRALASRRAVASTGASRASSRKPSRPHPATAPIPARRDDAPRRRPGRPGDRDTRARSAWAQHSKASPN